MVNIYLLNIDTMFNFVQYVVTTTYYRILFIYLFILIAHALPAPPLGTSAVDNTA